MSQFTGRALEHAQTLDRRIDAMPRVGLSGGAWFALMIMFFFANYETSVFALALPQMMEQLKLNVVDVGLPVAANMIAFGFGALFVGWVADRKGRQSGMCLTAIILALGGILSAFSWDIWSFTVFRFICGAGMGAVPALATTYIGELAPKHLRGKYLAKLILVGLVINAVAGFASLPLLESTSLGWRLLYAFGGLVIVLLFFINGRAIVESPRWLAVMGYNEKAAHIVSSMERRVGIVPDQVAQTRPSPRVPETETRTDEPSVTMRAMFRRPFGGRMAIVLTFWSLFYLAVYGFNSYSPLILGGLGLSVSDALFVIVLARLAPLVSGWVAVMVIERWERRTLTMVGAGILALAFVIIGLRLGTGGATLGVLLCAFSTSFIGPPAVTYTSEIFPTRARASASAIADGFGHVGGALAPVVVLPLMAGVGSIAVLSLLAVVSLFAALIVRLGPTTRNRSLEDIASDPVVQTETANTAALETGTTAPVRIKE
ncbi:MFS transporter [Pseudarthrobacter sp. lyk4-40-TYG-27]|uniref:MFS transporter n=1 Tax=Pseudarthrobacter sp. lyk4-40-TYG-27 TaxID=3040305 RepID=UPI00255681A1|nr:MFS transporter [Pseudarthrobacter sp. lyk4-40-TYG-27]